MRYHKKHLSVGSPGKIKLFPENKQVFAQIKEKLFSNFGAE
jgi:hypothetical protein